MNTTNEYLKQLKCSGCGQNITDFDRNADFVVCPYCKAKSVNPFKNQNNNSSTEVTDGSQPSLIFPFQTTIDDFSDQIIAYLVKTNDVPLDIFQQLSFDNIMKLYVPYFNYQGNFNSSWQCEVPYKVGSGQDQKTEYRPHSGFTTGNFKVLCPAWTNTASNDEDNTLPGEIIRFIENDDVVKGFKDQNAALFNSSMVQNSDNEDEPKFKVMKVNKDPRLTWNTEGTKVVEKIAKNRAEEQAPSGYRNLRASTNSNLDFSYQQKSESVLVPFWYTQYSYGEQQYFFVSSGVNKNLKDMSHPVDDSLHKRNSIFGFSIFGLVILAVILGFAVNWYVAIAPLVIAGVLFFINYRFNSTNKEARIAAARSVFGDLEILNKL